MSRTQLVMKCRLTAIQSKIAVDGLRHREGQRVREVSQGADQGANDQQEGH